MRFRLFVSFLSLGWFLSCNQVNPRDELLFTLISGLSPVSTNTTSVSVGSSAKINVSSASVTLTYGTSQLFGISLVKLPTANVTITLTYTDTSKYTINGSATSPSPTVLTFTPANYNVPQTISLNSTTQIIDSSSLTITATSADTYYNNVTGSVSITHRNVNIVYTGSSFIFQQNVVAPNLTPTISFTHTSCSVAPSLPTGLSLNTSTCVISGTPTNPQAGATYTVTATNGSESDTQNLTIQIEPTVYKVFITAQTYTGDLQGVSGADTKCNADANKPATGTYKAMLTTDGGARVACTSDNCGGGAGENTDWVFQSGRIYIRASDSASLLSPNAAGILPADGSGNFTTNPYNLNHPFDSGTTNKEFWTGFAQTNYWQTATAQTTNSCNGWTLNVGPSTTSEGGRVGASNSTNYSAFRNGIGRSCALAFYLLCVEQ